AAGWLYRSAVRVALNELRRQTRATRHESLADTTPGAPTPEDIHALREQQEQVRTVLAALDSRQSELLILRGSGLSYDELASALDLNPASVGTLLSRAQHTFRQEFSHRFGEQ
ncbi:MAG: polymerase, sigma-24 subunit, subfamily, partial [Candidatus Solibacter sp.]|nr:polymerase, sigma-24 subunit, subfamily [Candidatus Solibacter sp.]